VKKNEYAIYNLLGIAYRAGKLVWGYHAVKASLERGKLYLIILAEDVSPRLRNKFLAFCRDTKKQVVFCSSKVDLGKALGKPPCAVVGICEKNLADIIKKKVQEDSI